MSPLFSNGRDSSDVKNCRQRQLPIFPLRSRENCLMSLSIAYRTIDLNPRMHARVQHISAYDFSFHFPSRSLCLLRFHSPLFSPERRRDFTPPSFSPLILAPLLSATIHSRALRATKKEGLISGLLFYRDFRKIWQLTVSFANEIESFSLSATRSQGPQDRGITVFRVISRR